jgi:hypothetical protein
MLAGFNGPPYRLKDGAGGVRVSEKESVERLNAIRVVADNGRYRAGKVAGPSYGLQLPRPRIRSKVSHRLGC